MSCRDWEEQVALYAGGDLPRTEASELERHLAGCPECSAELESHRQGLAWLREEHGQAVPAAAYTAVRTRVLAELEGSRARVWRWFGAWGLAVAAVALVFVLAPWQSRTPERQAEVGKAPVKVPAIAQAQGPLPDGRGSDRGVARRLSRLPRREPVVRAVAERREPAEPVVVQLLTDDPNVIIYWISDRKGD